MGKWDQYAAPAAGSSKWAQYAAPAQAGLEELNAMREQVPVETVGPGAAYLHGGVDTIPFGQKATALGTALILKLNKALHKGEPWADNLDTSYEGQLATERQKLIESQEQQPWATRAGKLTGVIASTAAMTPFKPAGAMGGLEKTLAAMGNFGTYGLAHGAGNIDWGDPDTEWEGLKNTVREGQAEAALGGAGHTLLSEVAPAIGGAVRNVGRRLKVNSLKPTPSMGKAMADLPGGTEGVGEELLGSDIGGITKAGTAKQAEAAMKEAGRETTAVVQRAEAAGAPPIDLTPQLDAAAEHAAQLYGEPTTRGAGERLIKLINEYRSRYSGPVSPMEALRFKRVLADEAYATEQEFARSASKPLSDYAAGVSKLERGVDASLDKSVGPEFEAANLRFRRLLLGSKAAEHSASKVGKDLFSLRDTLAAAGVGGGLMASGHGGMKEAAGAALASALASRYGAQAGARTLDALGFMLEAPSVAYRGADPIVQSIARSSTAQTVDPYIQQLIKGLRQGRQPQLLAYGEDDQ